MKYALSINGGGIRGIIPCSVLASLELQTGKLTRDLFSYVSGTSTGALLAAAIAAGIPARELLTVYTTRSKDVFHPTGLIGTAKRITKGYMYEPSDLAKVLTDIGIPAWTMNDCPIGICISAVASNGHNWFFVRDNPRNRMSTGKIKLIDAAVASASAPSYFDHFDISMPGSAAKGTNNSTLSFFDGGAGGLGNPSYQTCVEMFEYDSFTPADTRLVSLGTGFYPATGAPPKGLLQVISWATSNLVDSSEDWVGKAVDRQWPGVKQGFDWQLPSDIAMDDLSAIPALLKIGAEAAATMSWHTVLA